MVEKCRQRDIIISCQLFLFLFLFFDQKKRKKRRSDKETLIVSLPTIESSYKLTKQEFSLVSGRVSELINVDSRYCSLKFSAADSFNEKLSVDQVIYSFIKHYVGRQIFLKIYLLVVKLRLV